MSFNLLFKLLDWFERGLNVSVVLISCSNMNRLCYSFDLKRKVV